MATYAMTDGEADADTISGATEIAPVAAKAQSAVMPVSGELSEEGTLLPAAPPWQ
ncbi:MAG TPA: hypothetical protein VLD59_00895 [Steroidobacteraceae bacterium]|nr:hypothetical protein [Steroidobacteraceae bacterium]